MLKILCQSEKGAKRMVRNISLLCMLLLILFLQGCLPKPVTPPTPDRYGCQPPPPDVLTSAGIDLQFAQSTFSKVVTGEVNIKTNPKVITFATKAVMDDRIRSYLRCLSIRRDGYTPEQAAYFDRLSVFMQTDPNTEQFLSWQEDNQFPPKEAGEAIEFSKDISLTQEYPSSQGYIYRQSIDLRSNNAVMTWQDSEQPFWLGIYNAGGTNFSNPTLFLEFKGKVKVKVDSSTSKGWAEIDPNVSYVHSAKGELQPRVLTILNPLYIKFPDEGIYEVECAVAGDNTTPITLDFKIKVQK